MGAVDRRDQTGCVSAIELNPGTIAGFARPHSESTTMSYRDKLNKIGSRKLLACDGGGIRGFISIEILAGIESELRKSSGNSRLVLADYFDYVAGTSTGAIIATFISLGHSACEIWDFYLLSCSVLFHKVSSLERICT